MPREDFFYYPTTMSNFTVDTRFKSNDLFLLFIVVIIINILTILTVIVTVIVTVIAIAIVIAIPLGANSDNHV